MMMALGLGPSPLARGKLSAASVTVPVMGTIPARAGETVQDAAYHTVHGDHPRSRGGNIAGCNFWATHLGPSPLARGKLDVTAVNYDARGTIPARAGETTPQEPRIGPQRDHPRSRGGNAAVRSARPSVLGPSPLARGKLNTGVCFWHLNGTIPARAGETAPNDYIELGTRDHPRSRGGNMPWPKTHYLFQGPSPLARGKRWLMRLAWMTSGTIPARAGETVSHEAIDPHLGDHPRSRGGNCQRLTVDDRYQGPSPLARGKRIRNQ